MLIWCTAFRVPYSLEIWIKMSFRYSGENVQTSLWCMHIVCLNPTPLSFELNTHFWRANQHLPYIVLLIIHYTELWAPERPDTGTVSSLRQSISWTLDNNYGTHTIYTHTLIYLAHILSLHFKLHIIYLYIQNCTSLYTCTYNCQFGLLLFLIYLFFFILLFIICVFLFCHCHSVALR